MAMRETASREAGRGTRPGSARGAGRQRPGGGRGRSGVRSWRSSFRMGQHSTDPSTSLRVEDAESDERLHPLQESADGARGEGQRRASRSHDPIARLDGLETIEVGGRGWDIDGLVVAGAEEVDAGAEERLGLTVRA